MEKSSGKKKILLIANERAGTGRIRYQLIDIIVRFMEAGYEVKVFPVEPEKGLTSEKALAGDLSGLDKIVVAGGDGTMSHVIQALMPRRSMLLQQVNRHTPQRNESEQSETDTSQPEESESPRNNVNATVQKVKDAAGIADIPVLGYIPAGSTNDFAKSLGIPSTTTGACRVILTGREFSYDIGAFQDTWFNYVAAFGAFVPVSFQTGQRAKNAFGHGAYILEGVASFQENISFSCPMKIAWDNAGSYGQAEGDFMFGAVYNASSIGGIRLPNATRKHLQDGEIELLLIRKPRTPEERHAIISDLMAGVLNSEFIITARVQHVHFETKQEIPWTLDGEDGGKHKDVAIGVVPKAMRIMIPQARRT